MSFSVAQTFAGREVLLTGVTGFVGKVFLVALLAKAPDVRAVHVLIRPRPGETALQRFERMCNESPAFRPLHETHGAGLSGFLRERVRVVEGDVSLPDLGLPPEHARSLGRSVSLVVSCAAVVDFDPDVRLALATNVLGARHLAELAERAGAALLHVSTCFTAGRVSGRIEEVVSGRLPSGAAFDAALELEALEGAIAALSARLESPARAQELEAAAREHLSARGHDPDDHAAVVRQVERLRHARDAEAWRRLGTERADARGWPNTYTYSKAIAERLLDARFAHVPHAVFRPAVVESAESFPFPGWNEGFNTCGPLAYLIGTWFKALPGRSDNPFDVVPVDHVAFGMLVAGAALLRREHRPVYHAATSDRNRMTLGRANELTGLGQRQFLRAEGARWTDRLLRSRADTTLFSASHPASVDNVDRALDVLARTLRAVPDRAPRRWRAAARGAAQRLERERRSLRRVAVMVDAFTPFTRDLRQSFVASALSSHDVDEAELRWAPETLDWRRYWLEVHMPGLRMWCFPLIEGSTPPRLDPDHPVRLVAPARDLDVRA